MSVGQSYAMERSYRGLKTQLTVFFVQIFDLVHVLPLTDDCVVVEHVSVGEGSEFWAGESGIFAEIQTMDRNYDGVSDKDERDNNKDCRHGQLRRQDLTLNIRNHFAEDCKVLKMLEAALVEEKRLFISSHFCTCCTSKNYRSSLIMWTADKQNIPLHRFKICAAFHGSRGASLEGFKSLSFRYSRSSPTISLKNAMAWIQQCPVWDSPVSVLGLVDINY